MTQSLFNAANGNLPGSDNLNLDDMQPYSYLASKTPAEYEAEIQSLRAEIERLKRMVISYQEEIMWLQHEAARDAD